MGLIIYPFLLIAMIAVIFTLVLLFVSIKKNGVSLKEVTAGFLITVVIYSTLFLNYKYGGSAYVLGTYFMFPFYMILLPFTLSFVAKAFKTEAFRSASISLLLSVVYSALFIALLNRYTFGLIDYLQIPKHY